VDNKINIAANAATHKNTLDKYKKIEFDESRNNIKVGIQIAEETKNINTEKFKKLENLK